MPATEFGPHKRTSQGATCGEREAEARRPFDNGGLGNEKDHEAGYEDQQFHGN